MAYTINHYITDWVEESRALMQPDKVLWIDGTETQLEELRREAYITRKSCRAAYTTAARSTTLPASRDARSSAAKRKRTPAPRTTGWRRTR